MSNIYIRYLLLIPLSTPLVVSAYMGHFMRPMIDDYWIANISRTQGFWAAYKTWYLGFTGRFSLIFMYCLTELLGSWTIRILPALAIISWLFCLTWALKRLLPINTPNISPFTTSLVISLIILYATLSSTPSLLQSLYWRPGMLTYLMPLILLTLYIGFATLQATKHNSIALLVMGFGLSFFAAGFSETNAILQLGVIFLLIIYSLLSKRCDQPFIMSLLIIGLIGTILALMVQFFSPGNAVRQSLFHHSNTLTKSIKDSGIFSFNFIFASFRTKIPLSTSIALLLPALYSLLYIKSEMSASILVKRIFLSFMVLYFLIFISVMPSFYATSIFPMCRTLIVPQAVLISFLTYSGYLLGQLIKKFFPFLSIRYVGLLLIVLMILGPLASTVRLITICSKVREEASMWDKLDQQIRVEREQGRRNVIINRNFFYSESTERFKDIDTIKIQPGFRLFPAISSYYDLESVIVE
jgi:hypothetical protein